MIRPVVGKGYFIGLDEPSTKDEVKVYPNPATTTLRVEGVEEGDKVMLQKFLIWKTNKEQSGKFPAYVFYYTDYSSGRKEFLKRDLRVSGSEQQIRAIMDEFISANIKKGWQEAI